MRSPSLATPIAVVGMACRLPGADGVDGFWSLLTEGGSGVVEMPPHRLDRELYYDPRRGKRGKTYSTIAGLVTGYPPQAGDESYDLCHRIFADVALEACRDAGMEPGRLASRRVGIYVGHSGGSPEFGDVTVATLAAQAVEPLRDIQDLQDLPPERLQAILQRLVDRIRAGKPTRTADGGPKTAARWAAELAARTLGIEGPNMVLDAACSSSLVALALGALALERGEVDAAIVGGASFAQTNSLILFSQAQSCSAQGSRPFDNEADGLVGSEGYVALVLKTEARARQDGDRILAVIRGVGLSTDGRGKHLWAPRKEGQTAAMTRAWGPQLDPAGIQYVEAHATSTQVGDATEIESMSDFFGPHVGGRKIPIGSVKSNLGHTLETAGVAGLLKVILAMKNGAIPPTINIETLNDVIDWDAVPFEVNRSLRPWPRPEGDVRRGAVSAFGIGGLNVHLVVEEPRPEGSEAPPSVGPAFDPIAIVGRGVVVPGAHGVQALRTFLAEGRPALSEAPSARWPGTVGVDPSGVPWSAPTCRGGFLTDYAVDSLALRIPPNQIASANPLQFQLLDATAQALKEAGPVDRAETAVVVGAQFGGDFANQLVLGQRFPELKRTLGEVLLEAGFPEDERQAIADAYEERFFDVFPALLDETGSFTSSTLASRVTKTFDLEGGALAIDAGDPSGLVAVGTACSMLRGRVCGTVVCAGAQRALDLPTFESLAKNGYFDDPDYHPGEGVGVVVLKRLEDARRDGNPVFGILLGEGSAYAEDRPGEAAEAAARRALEAAGLESGQVQRRSPGGGHSDVSRTDQAALQKVYGADCDQRSGLTDLTGHLGAAQGVVALIHGTLDPQPVVEAHHGSSGTGLSVHVLQAPAPPTRTGRGSRFRLRLGAPTLPRLRERLVYAGDDADAPFAETDRFRLAVVSPDPGEMPFRLGMAEANFDTLNTAQLEDQGIYFGEVPAERPRVAFVFSGQGSQYAGMLQELVDHSPAARRTMEEANRALQAAGVGTFAELAWGTSPRLDEDPVTTQLSVLVADTLLFAAVTEHGLEPDCVCGHSFGEISAMVAARVITLDQAIRITIERARALGAADPEGGLVSIQAPAEEVRRVLASLGGELYVTHVNAPQQTVVGGKGADLAEVVRTFEEKNVRCTPLKVPGALHSPLVAAAQQPLRTALERETLRPPTRLFYSNVTCDQVSRPEQFVTNLVAQLVEPLDYPSLVHRLVHDGVGALVEVGPGQVLTRLHRQILGPAVACTSTDHARRGAWEQLERAWTALECVGAVPSRSPVAAPVSPPLGKLVEFDATAVRRHRRRNEAAAAPIAAPGAETEAEAEGKLDAATVALLLDFVVDLTGYPRHAISLDWDLEADLGLDSIKRTHLVGELAEALGLDLDATAAGTLAELQTLRELLGFLEGGAPLSTPEATAHAPDSRDAAMVADDPLGWPDPDSAYDILAPESAEDSVASPVSVRYVLRAVELPHAARGPGRRLEGAALVVGTNPVAAALKERLKQQGVIVHAIDPDQGPDAAAEAVDHAWKGGPAKHLFLAVGHDADAVRDIDTAAWSQRRSRVLMVPFAVAQRWVALVKEADLMDEASLVALTELGGDFGFSGQLESFESGSVTGLVKAVVIESWVAGYRHLAAKVIDAPSREEPSLVVDAALRELAHPSYEVEIGVTDGTRRVVRPVRSDLAEPAPGLDLGRNWVCTGGARGITAHVATELARRFGLTLHLIGRAPAPRLEPDWTALWPHRRREIKVAVMNSARADGKNPVQAWEDAQKAFEIRDTLEHLRELGVRAIYYPCDISDRDAVDRVLAEVRQRGPIDGVLHGAGASRDTKFEHKEPRRVDECFRAKVDGTLALMEAIRNDPVRYFVAFGSVSGRFGANGHADYSTANDMLAKQVDWYRRRRPEVAAVAIHWHAWGDVGMATKAQTQLGLQLADVRFMPAEEGMEHLIRELAAGAPEGEVLITEERYCARYVPVDDAGTQGSAGLRRQPLLATAPEHGADGSRVFDCTLDPERDVFLREHLLDGRPVLPMVVALELASEAALEDEGGPFVLRDVEIFNGLRFHRPGVQKARVLVSPVDNGVRTCLVAADFSARDGTLLEADRPLVRAAIESLGGSRSERPALNGGAPRGTWLAVDYTAALSRLRHGPSLQALRSVCLEDDGLWGSISATSIAHVAGPQRPSEGWRIHAPALDACLFAAGYLAWAIRPGTTVPAGVARMLVGRFPHAREDCLVHVRPDPMGEPGERFHFTLFGADGAALVEAEGYRVVRLGPSPDGGR